MINYHKIFNTYKPYQTLSLDKKWRWHSIIKEEENLVKQKKLLLIVAISFAYHIHIIRNTATQLKIITPLFVIYIILHSVLTRHFGNCWIIDTCSFYFIKTSFVVKEKCCNAMTSFLGGVRLKTKDIEIMHQHLSFIFNVYLFK